MKEKDRNFLGYVGSTDIVSLLELSKSSDLPTPSWYFRSSFTGWTLGATDLTGASHRSDRCRLGATREATINGIYLLPHHLLSLHSFIRPSSSSRP
jgi:hypothetical protein